MKVLVVGSGGREHTLIWKLKKSPKVSAIYAVPGNGGMYDIAECYPDIPYEKNFSKIIKFVKDNKIDLTIVGPENPFANGITDEFRKNRLRIFGQSKKATMLESSKNFAKKIMEKGNIPTSKYRLFTDYKKAVKYLNRIDFPLVIKADGLAKGKGVFIIETKQQGIAALNSIMIKKEFDQAGNKVIIEEFLDGKEFTVLSFVDGKNISVMPLSRDHKKLLDNDKGPNTGGMGAFAPIKIPSKDYNEIMNNILLPTIKILNKEKITYKGVLYTGLIKTKNGFKVLEFNCRFGDPEAQVILPLLETDLIDIITAIEKGTLNKLNIKWSNKKTMTVCAVSKGYPGKYNKGYPIRGLKAITDKNLIIFNAGTKINNNTLLTNGGRVLNITCIAKNLQECRKKIYNYLKKIHFCGIFYRKDIGNKFD